MSCLLVSPNNSRSREGGAPALPTCRSARSGGEARLTSKYRLNTVPWYAVEAKRQVSSLLVASFPKKVYFRHLDTRLGHDYTHTPLTVSPRVASESDFLPCASHLGTAERGACIVGCISRLGCNMPLSRVVPITPHRCRVRSTHERVPLRVRRYNRLTGELFGVALHPASTLSKACLGG